MRTRRARLGRVMAVLGVLILAVGASALRSPAAYAFPDIAGNYTGSYQYQDSAGATHYGDIDITVNQYGSVTCSGAYCFQSLDGTTTDQSTGATSTNSGAVDDSGYFSIAEFWSTGGWMSLNGSSANYPTLTGSLQFSAPNNNLTGSFSMVLVPTVSGNYTGSYTWNGSSSTFPMQITITQVGSILGGTSDEGGSISTNSGTDYGSFFVIAEAWPGGGNSYLDGSGSSSSGELSGTWNNYDLGTGGTWDVM